MKRFLSILLCFMMMLTFIPAFSLDAYAAENPDINGSYDANGGTWDESYIAPTYNTGESLGYLHSDVSCHLSRENAEFYGWLIKGLSIYSVYNGKILQDGFEGASSVWVSNPITLIAQWITDKTVLVEWDDGFESASASYGENSGEIIDAEVNQEIKLSCTPVSGYEFDHWEVISGTAISGGGIEITNDTFIKGEDFVKIKAVSKQAQYVIAYGRKYTFDGIDTEQVYYAKIDNETKTFVAEPTTAAVEGYNFKMTLTPQSGDSKAKAAAEFNNTWIPGQTEAMKDFLDTRGSRFFMTAGADFTVNLIGTCRADISGNTTNVYLYRSETEDDLTITGGTLIIEGNHGWSFDDTAGNLKIDLTGDLRLDADSYSSRLMYSKGDTDITAKDIYLNTQYVCMAGSGTGSDFRMEATGGDIYMREAGSSSEAMIREFGNITVLAPKGEITMISDNKSSGRNINSSGGKIEVKAKGDIGFTSYSSSGNVCNQNGDINIESASGNIIFSIAPDMGKDALRAGEFINIQSSNKATVKALKGSVIMEEPHNGGSSCLKDLNADFDIQAGNTIYISSCYGPYVKNLSLLAKDVYVFTRQRGSGALKADKLDIKADNVVISASKDNGINAKEVSITDSNGNPCDNVFIGGRCNESSDSYKAFNLHKAGAAATIKAEILNILAGEGNDVIDAGIDTTDTATLTIEGSGVAVGSYELHLADGVTPWEAATGISETFVNIPEGNTAAAINVTGLTENAYFTGLESGFAIYDKAANKLTLIDATINGSDNAAVTGDNLTVEVYGDTILKENENVQAFSGNITLVPTARMNVAVSAAGISNTYTQGTALKAEDLTGNVELSTVVPKQTIQEQPTRPHRDDSPAASAVVAPTVDTPASDVPIAKTEEKTDESGNVSKTIVDINGKQTSNIAVSETAAKEAAAKGEAITLPVPEVKPASAEAGKENAPAVNVELPKGTTKAKVNIPVAKAANTVVLMKVENDGSLTPVPTSAVSSDGKGLCADIEQGSYVIVDNKVEFNDIKSGAWYESGANFAAARKLMVGVGGDNFGGNGTLTTAQTAAVIDRLGGAAVTDSWNKAVEKYGKTEINTRENTMSMLYEAYKAMGGKKITVAPGTLDSFTDASSVSANDLEAMQWAVQIGLLNGIGGGLVDPLGELTRAQFGTILERFVNLLTNGTI